MQGEVWRGRDKSKCEWIGPNTAKKFKKKWEASLSQRGSGLLRLQHLQLFELLNFLLPNRRPLVCGVTLYVLREVVAPHELAPAERATIFFLPRVGPLVSGQLVRPGEASGAVLPAADIWLFPSVRPDVSLEVGALVVCFPAGLVRALVRLHPAVGGSGLLAGASIWLVASGNDGRGQHWDDGHFGHQLRNELLVGLGQDYHLPWGEDLAVSSNGSDYAGGVSGKKGSSSGYSRFLKKENTPDDYY